MNCNAIRTKRHVTNGQLEVKKNKEALSKLKTENKDLRSQLSSLMSDQGRNASSSDMNKLEKQVSDLRRTHDDVKHKLLMRQKEVSGMRTLAFVPGLRVVMVLV